MSRKSRHSPASSGEAFQLVLIRHAEAVEAGDFQGSDLDRPLTSKGWKDARKALKRLTIVCRAPAVVYHSAARRARETALALKDSHPRVRLVEDPALNPGAAPSVFRRLAVQGAVHGSCVVVGHEPDLSEAIAELTGGACRMRKTSVAVIERAAAGLQLVALFEAGHLRAMRRP